MLSYLNSICHSRHLDIYNYSCVNKSRLRLSSQQETILLSGEAGFTVYVNNLCGFQVFVKPY